MDVTPTLAPPVLPIDGDRLWSDLMELATIGASALANTIVRLAQEETR